MPVCWDVKNCKNFYENFPDGTEYGEPAWNAMFIALTYVMLAIGPPPTDEKDTKGFDEFVFRVRTYEKIIGALCSRRTEDNKPEDVFVTDEQFKALIGLRINHSKVSPAKFNAWLVRCIRSEYERSKKS